ncbi:anaerobic glycerol-3-phosphate dehydrogenase subunit C [Planctomicrobium sp. SH664]|uniref:anaerobic glycerol-3-phosphate dehydrogenase subunit C n=1 Tax=Planctomicrobium sp. SH664 TaxID=3448125 RepID=UPI003F5B83EB
MDDRQQRIVDDLAGLFHGELRFDDVAREIYSTDGSLYQIRPTGVAFPRHREDVITLAQYAASVDLPLIARGAGSGLAGGALGDGLIVDFSRHMHAIEQIAGQTVRVQSGVVCHQLNRALAPHGRYFAPDPSRSAVTTLGGMLAVNAAGAHAVRVGSTSDHVQSLECVLADGTLLEAFNSPKFEMLGEAERLQPLLSKLASLLRHEEQLIRERQPPHLCNASGYRLRSVLQGDFVNLPRLLIGSEGTLGLFTAATLQTLPLPAHRSAALLLFHDLEKAIEAVQAVRSQQPSACDLLDRRLLSLARDADQRFAILIPQNAEAAVLIEQTGYTDRQVRDRLAGSLAMMKQVDSTMLVAAEAYTASDVEFLWSLPLRVIPLLSRLRGDTRPLPYVEDIAVPPAVLHDFLVRAHKVFQKHWVTASLYAHAASGQVHFRPFLASPTAQNAVQIEALARELYEAAIACGGTVSAQNGNGLARTAFIRSQYGPLYRVFQQIKALFDPHNLLNPGKIISDDPHLTIRNFRLNEVIPQPEPTPLVPLQLKWTPGEFLDTSMRCNGCGDCRVQSEFERMCPFFHQEQVEDASPRSKANLMRALGAGSLDWKTFSTDEAKGLADRCFNCKQCQLECPSNVNIPALAIEAKAQCVAANGLSRADWMLSRAHSLGWLGASLSPLANWAIGNSGARWLIEKLVGISQKRRLPRFARREFLQVVREQPRQKTAEQVVFFVDHFVNFHDHELGHALIRILQHHDIAVRVPSDQLASGMAMISAGDLDAARKVAQTNVRILAEYAREGIPIVCTEPTAAVCLKQEYPRLIDHPDVAIVAERTIEAGTYLQGLLAKDRLRTDFTELPLQLGYHTPCHLRALTPDAPLAGILSLVPGLTIRNLERGCSGMAGAFGLTAANFETSMAMGSRLVEVMENPNFLAGVTECSSCRMQMEQRSRVPTIHPLKLLAFAYGLMPEIRERLKPITPGRRIST